MAEQDRSAGIGSDDSMEHYTADEVRDALRPIASLIGKSEKAQQKLAPGTWQHAMLCDNVKALRIAVVLLDDAGGDPGDLTVGELEDSLHALGAMIGRVEGTKAKFAPGTSQHSLQRNRLKALRIARAAVESELARR